MKKVTLCLCLLACLTVPTPARAQGALSQRVDELSQQIAAKMAAKQKTTVAVVEFTDLQGNVTDFGRFLAEELVTRLYDAGKFKVIERQPAQQDHRRAETQLNGSDRSRFRQTVGKNSRRRGDCLRHCHQLGAERARQRASHQRRDRRDFRRRFNGDFQRRVSNGADDKRRRAFRP
jgi:TolB-like protein